MQMSLGRSHLLSWVLVSGLLASLAPGTVAEALASEQPKPSARPTRSGNYLIITASDYADSAPLIQFKNAKAAMGFDVAIYSVPSGTSRSDIKAYIEGLWETPDAPDYILLVGDTSGSTSTATTIPYWSGGGSKAAPTDLPYACMGEGDDWYPDIAIGRFSVNSVSGLQTVVDKSLFVEAGVFPDSEYVKRGAFLANPSTVGQAEPTHDWVIDNYFTPNGYEGIKLYAAEGAGTADVADAVNNGCLWVGYFGHSGSTGWWSPSFSQGDVQALSNLGLYGVAWSFSCNVGNYTLDECFGETWLREADKGAAAVIFPSSYIYWGSVEAWEPSVVLEKSFFRAFFESGIWEVGPAWQKGLSHFLADSTSSMDIKRNFFELYNLLGDPALLLPRLDGFTLDPSPLEQSICHPVVHEAVYTIEVEQLGDFGEAITLSTDGEPVGSIVDFSVNSIPPPFTTVMTVTNIATVPPGPYTIQISGVTASTQRSTFVGLNVANGLPGEVALTSPPDGQIEVARMPTLTWEPSTQAADYALEIATDPDFTNVVYSAVANGTHHTVDINLETATVYYWHVRAGNGCGEGSFSDPFEFTTLIQADYFTEQFEGSFDLENFTVVFIPDGSGDYYRLCGYEATEFPTDPGGGTSVSLSDDDYEHVTLTDDLTVAVYGVEYGGFYIGSNGYITFDSGDSNYSESLADHFGQSRISGVFDDLNPSSGGSVTWEQLEDRAVVTWDNIPEYGTSNSNNFQIQMFFDGEITITWLGVDSGDSIAGLSEGNDLPDDYVESDLSAAGPCFTVGDGDFDSDGDVDLFDVLAFQECFGLGAVDECAPGNMAGGEVIDLDDFTEFANAMDGPS